MQVEPIFMLKKILTVALMPWSIAILFSLLALFFLYRNKIRKAKQYIIFSILWAVIMSWAPFADAMLKPLENSYKRLEYVPKDVKYVLLLGGDRKQRAWEVLRLYHQRPDLTIITSGYSLHGGLSDARKTANLLIESGIPEKNILLQEQSKTTYEEAQDIQELIGKERFILVTSAYHMPRSMKLFQKAGLKPIAAPTDFNMEEESGVMTMLQSHKLEDTEHAWHEYLGMFVYRLQGKI
jgi:uncharacterized SAM-binding protein YcdF (DUF218 family)